MQYTVAIFLGLVALFLAAVSGVGLAGVRAVAPDFFDRTLARIVLAVSVVIMLCALWVAS